MREANIRSRKAGEKNVSGNSVRKVTEVCLRDNADHRAVGGSRSNFLVIFYRKLCENLKDDGRVLFCLGPGSLLGCFLRYILFHDCMSSNGC